MKHIEYQKMKEHSITDIAELFRKSGKRNSDTEHFSQKYAVNYTGLGFLGCVAFDGDTPVGFLGLVPVFISSDNEQMIAAQATDGIVLPKYRGHGIFEQLINRIEQLADELNIHCVSGVPNNNSLPVFQKNKKWQIHTELKTFRFQVPMFPFAQLCRRHRIMNKLFHKYVSFLLKKYRSDHQWQETNLYSGQQFSLNRSEEYISYKTFTDNFIIELVQNKAWLKFQGTLKIGDLTYKNLKELKKMIHKLKVIAFFTGIRIIRFRCSENSHHYANFCKLTQPDPYLHLITFSNLQNKKPLDLHLTFADLDTF
jgi:GNAT superfamily N-acetyltransferase